MNEHIQKAQDTWDTIDVEQVRNVSWLSISYFGRQVERGLTDNYRTPLAFLLSQRYSEEACQELKGLALVCGDMEAERGFFESLPNIRFSTVDGYDLSPESIKRYQPKGCEFRPHIMDANDIALEPNQFDLIVGCHGIHHIYNLGGMFYQTHKAIKPEGLFVLHEWVGPPYLQIPLRNHIIASFLLFVLFPSRRVRTTHMNRVKGVWLQSRPQAFDPSEACNANELMPQLLKYFKPIRIVKYGALAYPMFEGIGHNIDEERPLNKLRIRIVFYIEQILIRLRIIRPLFVSAVVEKRADIFRQYHWTEALKKHFQRALRRTR
ncbi:class I SAM-dependent methyltransferase [bacterium]|nr:class I SAM-dependent methyltransferase [bacterium]